MTQQPAPVIGFKLDDDLRPPNCEIYEVADGVWEKVRSSFTTSDGDPDEAINDLFSRVLG